MNDPGDALPDFPLRQALIEALGEVVYDWRPLEDRLDWGGAYARILG